MRSYRNVFDGMHALYVNGMLRSMVFAFIGIFTPLYVYREAIAYGYQGWTPIALVAGFYLVTRLTVLLSAISVSHFIERIGFRKSIFISAIFLAAYLLLLKLAPLNFWYLFLAAIFGGLTIPWYWIARGSVISQDGTKQAVGRQMGWMMSIEQISAMMGPLLAGLIVERWGFGTLYSLAFVILCLSVLPLWYMPGHTHVNGASWGGFWQWITNRRYFHQAVGVAAKSVDDYAITIFWPLAIYLMGWHLSSVGGLFSLIALVSLSVRVVSGRTFDVLRKRRDLSDEIVFGFATVGTSIIWIIRLFVQTVRSVLAVDLIGAIFGTLYGSMYVNYEQLGGMRMGTITYWVYVELVYSLVTVLTMIALIIGAWLGIWKEMFIFLSAMWVLFGTIQARESNL